MHKFLLATVAVVGTSLATLFPGNVSNQTALDNLPTLELPAAASNSNVFSLGSSTDPVSGKSVEGYAIVRRVKGNAKPDNPGGGKGKDKPGGDTTSSCYAYLAKNAKWKSVEPWFFNPANTDGLDKNTLYSTFESSVSKWEEAASYKVMGGGTHTTNPLSADMISPDGNNEVYFASIDDPGVIGVTIVWGIFGGRPAGRELVEWDQVYDNSDYSWSLSGEEGDMDFENIATHELGHAVGLADLYTAECGLETMYGYADFAETYKQDLHDGDISGVFSLYR